jgi:nicotinamidase/pyrazinamidase
MAHRTELLIIDAQNDFCDLPESHRPLDPLTGARQAPALPVPGAHADMLRLASLVRAAGGAIDGITVTLDSHHRFDIAHPTFWRQRDGSAVTPFSAISAAALRSGDYQPRDAAHLPRALAYLDALQAGDRYTLVVWPVHCQIGSWGQGLHADLAAACNAWEESRLRPLHAVFKGSNPWTEHYSALQAEVPAADDPATSLNNALLARLAGADTLLIAGQASSHCVKATVEHLVAHLPGGAPQRLLLLTDCMSPVTGFEPQAAAFLAAMQALGVRSMSQAEALVWLRGSARGADAVQPATDAA